MKILIVNADDLGLCEGVNQGILETVKSGTVSVASAFAMPGFDFDPQPFIQLKAPIGIHFSLNFGRPVSPLKKIPSLLEGGSFRTAGHEACAIEEIKFELLAQYTCFVEKTGLTPAHMNFHKHLNEMVSAVQEAALGFAREFSLSMRSKNPRARELIRSRGIKTNDHFLGAVSEEPFWTLERLKCELAELPEGVTELMCHPGRNSGEIEGLRYLAQRDAEADTFTTDEAQRIIAKFHDNRYR
jgi:predicted glycoside hydrolase/deacetylase ChbG (UPF0249 family)